MTRLQELLKTLPPIDVDLPHAPTTFHPFDRLPLKMKNKIWSYAVSEPRFIRLYEVMYNDHCRVKDPQLKNQQAVPPILHVSRQARDEGLRYYTPCLEFDPKILVEKERGISQERKYVYINFAVDIFLFERVERSFVRRHWPIRRFFNRNIGINGFSLLPETLKRCQRLAFTCEPGRHNLGYLRLLKKILERDGMEDITVLAHEVEAQLYRIWGPFSILGDLMRADLKNHLRAELDAGRNNPELKIRWPRTEDAEDPNPRTENTGVFKISYRLEAAIWRWIRLWL
ncbi:hypothetical protein BDZ45DRAFT_793685 [Acephala macrosclerotiorum]|nr:hypothetical protein BDZ45DRAFT_793685 [Acephala macrosclerotiorum]